MPMGKHKDHGLLNFKVGEHSTMTLIDHGLDLTKWKVDGRTLATDQYGGNWKVKQVGTGPGGKDIQVILTCTKAPTFPKKEALPTDGTLTITMTDTTTTMTVSAPVDYVSDTPP